MAQNRIQGPEDSAEAQIRFGAILGGRAFDFDLTWDTRFKGWLFSMFAADGTALLDSIRVVPNLDMLQPYSDARMPPGKLVCHDTTNLGQHPKRNDWRERHIIVYVDPEEPEEPLDIRVEFLVFPE